MYLGKALALTNIHDIELKHRIREAWATKSIRKTELTDKRVPVHLRLKLFDSVVTPTVLYGSSSWVMTGTREAELRTTQMKMLRTVIGVKRKVLNTGILEEWVNWIKRATNIARELMEKHGVTDWVDAQISRTQKWAEKLNSMETDRWATRVLRWQPFNNRNRGRPLSRWEDQSCLTMKND